MSSLATDSIFHAPEQGPRLEPSGRTTPDAMVLGDNARQALLIGMALATAGAIALLGKHSLVALPAAAGAAAILASPELGMYALLMALMLPVPIAAFGVVLYPHDAVAVMTIASAMLAGLRRKDLIVPPALYLAPAAALLMTLIVSLVNSAEVATGTAEVVQQFYLILVAPAAYFMLFRDRRILNRASRLLMLLGTGQALLVCSQFLLARAGNTSLIDVFAFGRSTFLSTTRVFGTIGPGVGILLVMSSFLWISRNDSARRSSSHLAAMRWPIVVLHILAMLATGTRSTMVVFFVTLIFYALFARRKALSLKIAAIAVAGLMIFVGIVGLSRFSESLVHATDARYRFPIDAKALRAVPDHPLVGHGPKASAALSISIFGARKVSVENEFVARLYDTGALGLAALFAFGAVPVLGCVHTLKRKQAVLPAAAIAAIIVGIYSGGPAGCIFEGFLGHCTIMLYAMMLAATDISGRRNAQTPATQVALPANAQLH